MFKLKTFLRKYSSQMYFERNIIVSSYAQNWTKVRMTEH